MSIHTNWITSTIDVDATTTGEFSGFDADQYSAIIDLGWSCDLVTVIIPTITEATISIYGVYEDGSQATNVPIPIYDWKDIDADGTVLQATETGTATKIVTFNCYGFRYIRIKASANQGSDRTFYVKGIKF